MEELKNDLREKWNEWEAIVEFPDVFIIGYMGSVRDEIDQMTNDALATSPANAQSLNLKRQCMLRCVANHEKSLLAGQYAMQIGSVWVESRKTMERIDQEIKDLETKYVGFAKHESMAMRILREKSKVEEVALGTRMPVFLRRSNGQGFLFQLNGIEVSTFDIKCLKAYFREPEHPPEQALAKIFNVINDTIIEYLKTPDCTVQLNEKMFQICCLTKLINLMCEEADKNESIIPMVPSEWAYITETFGSEFDEDELMSLGLISSDLSSAHQPHRDQVESVQRDILTNSSQRRPPVLCAAPASSNDSSQSTKLVDTVLTILRDANRSDLKLSGYKLNSELLDSLSRTLRCSGLHLEHLDLSNNKITLIPGAFLHNLDRLSTLNMSQNCIETLFTGVFSNIISLKELDLSANNISHLSSYALGQDLGGTLQKLNLSSNKLTEIKADALGNLKVLRHLDLSNNPIESIDIHAFDDLRSLQTLDLSSCRLQSVDMKLLDPLAELESLNLSGNWIESLLLPERGKFEPKAVGDSGLEDPEPDFDEGNRSHRIKPLNPSCTQLVNFNLSCLERFIQDVQISDNQLERDSNQADHPARSESKLKTIDLSNNRLTTLDDDFFHPFPGLTSVDLRSNALELTIDENTFTSNALSELKLTENKAIVIRATAWDRFKDLTGILKEWREPDDQETASPSTSTP